MIVLPKTQALNSTTFHAPPLHDESLTLTHLYDWQHEHSPDHPLFLYEDQPGEMKTIRWGPAVRAMHQAARIIASKVPPGVVSAAIDGRPIVVGTLATTGKSFWMTILESGYEGLYRYDNLCHDRNWYHSRWLHCLPDLPAQFTGSHRPPAKENRSENGAR